jgi:hypothetical protein
MFNAIGYPNGAGGLDGQKATSVRFPSRSALFADNVVVIPSNPTGWHRTKPAGYVMLVDGHTEFHTPLTATNLIW